jgi:hypothetical protein
MLDQIIENIIQKIRKEVVQPGMDYIPLAYIFTRNIPDSIKHFFDQEVELWMREEAQKFTSNERFDYEMPEVQMLIDKVFDILKQTATFHINQFNRLLERAIKLEANYLIRPQQTLTQFLFKDNFVVTTIEVYDMLKYFDKFEYYKSALTDYFNLKYMREISQTQFEELIRGIDGQVYTRNPVETILQTVKAVNNFLNEGRSTPADVLSIKILLMILKDRNLTDYAYLIEREGKDQKLELTFYELEQILRSGKPLGELEEEVEETVALEEIVDLEEEKPEVEVESITVTEEIKLPREVEEEYYEEVEEEYYEEEEEEEEEVHEEPVATIEDESPRALKAGPPPSSAVDQLADLVGGKMKGEHLEDLSRIISSRKRKRFIKKIFNKRERQFQEFVNLMNSTPTWKHASNLIDNFFYQKGINPYSKEALELSDMVYNRYFPKWNLATWFTTVIFRKILPSTKAVNSGTNSTLFGNPIKRRMRMLLSAFLH